MTNQITYIHKNLPKTPQISPCAVSIYIPPDEKKTRDHQISGLWHV